MSFTQQREKLSFQVNRISSVEEYQKEYLSLPIVDWMNKLIGKYSVHLYNDLFEQETGKDLKLFLNDYFGAAEEHAKNCISIAVNKDHLYGVKIKDWTNSALPAFDNFLLKLIQDVLREKVIRKNSNLYESDVYKHLISKGGDFATIGTAFQSIYQERNSFIHVQIEDDKGNRKQIRWGSKRYQTSKELILMQFNTALKALDNLIK
jgi:hypothetical protein